MARWGWRASVAALALGLAGCSGTVVPPARNRPAPVQPSPRPAPKVITPAPAATPTPTPTGAASTATAFSAGWVAGPAVASLPITSAQAARALIAFRLSCPALVRRTDASGLTRGADWQPACDAANGVSADQARDFFARWFEAVQIGDGRAFATGYYEPEIKGARTRQPGYETPIYARPTDLIDVDLGLFSDALKGRRVRGRVQGSALVPYDDRTAIEQGSLNGRAPVIAWAADPIELFFLQIQGSGRLRLPDGGIMRIGYDSQNGRDYTGIGALLRDRGLLGPGQASMQGIVGWLRDHPQEGVAVMRENKSYVFFRELKGPPQGALGYAVTGRVTAAVDPKFVPLGAPVFLSLDRAEATGLWVAQDTGGAIKGANRFDTFWGAGDEAKTIAGGMSGRGTALLLLPVGTLARLGSSGSDGGSNGGATPQR
ncbi:MULTISPECIES: murein transglycosylase A [Sphingomonas]|uniref:murein transglycosylase A n=1 Tax=Sphingomonas TaxID=13687 RepID=UPI0008308E6F|nr:murein transglycosylase A [Sphingomonas sp. CCH10-B3]